MVSTPGTSKIRPKSHVRKQLHHDKLDQIEVSRGG
jgi:hypothetical protein